MSNDALYAYGVVKFGMDLDWQKAGIKGQKVYVIGESIFSALVHDSEDKAYALGNSEEIKEMIISHNHVLDQAMEDFGGVIPLSFNTIIKSGTSSAQVNLKKWLHDDQERLERIWNKIKGKKEYGIRVYYEKEKHFSEAFAHKEVKNIEKNSEGKGPGVRYLLQGKMKSKTQEFFQEKVKELKQRLFEDLKKITEDAVNNPSRISLDEEKDLLASLSVLAEEKQINQITEFLEKKAADFPFQIAGPFAPYSFVENEK